MHWYSKVILGGLFLASLPAGALAQSDICQTPRPGNLQSTEEKVAAMQIQAQERSREETARAGWDVKMFSVKNAIPEATLRALCIFRIEVVPEPTLRLVSVRAPKELMASIEQAIQRVDVPPPPPSPRPPLPVQKTVELTAYVLIATDEPELRMKPVPQELQAVANQLKSMMPANFYLGDVVVARGREGQRVDVRGNTNFMANVNIRDGADAVVRLDNLQVSINFIQGVAFNTNVDIPVGRQIVVGKTTSTPGGGQSGGQPKAVVLVVTAKIMD